MIEVPSKVHQRREWGSVSGSFILTSQTDPTWSLPVLGDFTKPQNNYLWKRLIHQPDYIFNLNFLMLLQTSYTQFTQNLPVIILSFNKILIFQSTVDKNELNNYLKNNPLLFSLNKHQPGHLNDQAWRSSCYWPFVQSSGRCPPERTELHPWWRLRWLSAWRTQTDSCE